MTSLEVLSEDSGMLCDKLCYCCDDNGTIMVKHVLFEVQTTFDL